MSDQNVSLEEFVALRDFDNAPKATRTKAYIIVVSIAFVWWLCKVLVVWYASKFALPSIGFKSISLFPFICFICLVYAIKWIIKPSTIQTVAHYKKRAAMLLYVYMKQ